MGNIRKLRLIGGDLSLDFVNTVGNHTSDDPSDELASYRDLVEWGQFAHIISDKDGRLLEKIILQPQQAQHALNYAHDIRETLFRIFTNTINGAAPKPGDLHTLNLALAQIPAHTVVIDADGDLSWEYSVWTFNRVLWPVLWAAAALLTSQNLHNVRMCENEGCGWLFIDTSRNHSRRWCSMEDCGNRVKARRHYQRNKSG